MAATGMRHVLFLTGEAPRVTPMAYLVEAAWAAWAGTGLWTSSRLSIG